MSSDYLELTVVNQGSYIKINAKGNIYQDECFVCLDTDEFESILILDCCKQKIHEKCLVNWILSKPNYHCAVCKVKIVDLSKSIPFNKFLTFLNIRLQQQDIQKDKIRDILINLYRSEPLVDVFLNDIDKTSDDNKIGWVTVLCNLTIGVFVLLIFVLLTFYVWTYR